MSRLTRLSAPQTEMLRLAGASFSAPSPQPPASRSAFTLVEMLVAMAITLVMMAAVVTLFANVSNSVRNRRATIEMSSQIRHVRNVLQQDLLGATCPGLTWQRSESNHGYIELIEGPYREGNASNLIDAIPSRPLNWPPTPSNPEIDHTTSIVPSGNVPLDQSNWITDGWGLGDADDILMLTVRNEHEPFVGRMPKIDNANPNFPVWESNTVESPLAEVVWFAIENPGYTDPTLTNDPTADRFFGEPGMRTIYRRTLLIAPWINPYQAALTGSNLTFRFEGQDFKPEPGLVRLLPRTVGQADVAQALAALVALQDRYDLSVRVEYDPKIERWKIMANTLSDLTKRENRFGHYGFRPGATERQFPYAIASAGSGYSGSANVNFVLDPDNGFSQPSSPARAEANIGNSSVASYTVESANYSDPHDRQYPVRPFAYVDGAAPAIATAQAMLNDAGEVVRVVHGPVPLWGSRRGEDVMLTDALGFDLRVFDPGAPIFGMRETPGDITSQVTTILEPSDPGYTAAYLHADNSRRGTNEGIGTGNEAFPYAGQGAFVDMGYGFNMQSSPPAMMPLPVFAPPFASSAVPWFFTPRAISDVRGNQLAPGYAVYDTWSYHYENNGRDDDNRDGDGNTSTGVDEATNGLDDIGNYYNPSTIAIVQDIRNGIDDVGERETTPPYDRPLRGMQVLLRAYERDSRAIRQVRVTQHLMPE